MSDSKPERSGPPSRDESRLYYPIGTPWADNDIYGHVNNVNYSCFDTAANRYLVEESGFDPQDGRVVGYLVHSVCHYHAPIAHPDELEAGLRVDRLGTCSVQYGITIFRRGEEHAAAHGHVVHVYVERAEDRAVPIPERLRQALLWLLVD